jgi:hypothetical protein
MGNFLLSEKFAGLVKPPEFRPHLTLPHPWPDVVKVIKVEPIRIVTQVIGKPVGLLSPVSNPTHDLRRVSSFIRRISPSDPAASQFPDPLFGAYGSQINKPSIWM